MIHSLHDTFLSLTDVEIVAITHLCDVFITKRKLRLSPAKQQLFLTREDYGKVLYNDLLKVMFFLNKKFTHNNTQIRII